MSARPMGRLKGAASFHTSLLFSSKASRGASLAWLKMGMLLLGLKLKRTFLSLHTAFPATGSIQRVVPDIKNNAYCHLADPLSVLDQQM